MRNVTPVRPVAPYIGGKRNLSRRLVELIDSIPHESYAEVFVGMGGVFFRRHRVPKAEVINDYGRDVATLFRILQRHYVQFLDMMKYQLTTRAEFERLAATDPATLTDLERAARFLYLQRTAFGGKVAGRNFGVSTGLPARFDLTKLVPMLESVHERLAGVVIECLPYGDFIERYDRPGVLFYADPPYQGSEGHYGKGLFSAEDHARLAELLLSIKGRFILSINDSPTIRKLYRRGASIEALDTTYTIAGSDHAQRVRELVITAPGAR
ncbi:MAG: DNA adenine methylase [Alphaproteobacteria bacterium]|nr:DNA adenine methylase [Alphaproteobacteria bacterium]